MPLRITFVMLWATFDMLWAAQDMPGPTFEMLRLTFEALRDDFRDGFGYHQIHIAIMTRTTILHNA